MDDDEHYYSANGASDATPPGPHADPDSWFIDVDEESTDEEGDQNNVVSLTLSQFVSTATELRRADMPGFTRFVLTGIYDGIQHQVDPIKDELLYDDGVQALRDFDSLLGFHEDVCVTSFLAVYVVPKFSDTLTRNIHLKHSFSNESGQHDDIPVHHIHNISIAKWGTNNLLRVFLPALYEKGSKNPCLDKDRLAIFYEQGLRPAMADISPGSTKEWPPSYSAELIRARGKDGTFNFQTRTLGAWFVPDLGDGIRRALTANGVPWAEGLFFLHQVRGVKSSSGHTPTHQAAVPAFTEFLREQHIHRRCLVEGKWWVDVGLEMASDVAKCLAWRTDSHSHIVQAALNISVPNAERITTLGSSKYVRDLTSHLTAVSGCRISPGSRARGTYDAAYLQMYTTDKALTYRPDGFHFGKFMTGQDILKDKADDYCRDLFDIYREAAHSDNHALARVEVRIPISNACNVLTDINVQTFRDGLVAVDSIVWWSLRSYRILAIKYILEQQSYADPMFRSMDCSLLLTAAAAWFVNGLHSTPDNGPASRDLMGKILPLVVRTDADEETLLYPSSTRMRTRRSNNLVAEEAEEEEEEVQVLVVEGQLAEHVPEDNMSVVSDVSDGPVPEHPRDRRMNHHETLPYAPHGIVFLRPIRIGEGVGMPRFLDVDVPMVTLKTFQYIFGIPRDNVNTRFFKRKMIVSVHPTRVANRVRNTPAHAPVNPPPNISNLTAQGYALLPTVADTGSDVEDMQDEIEGANDGNIDTKLALLWSQFLVDLTAKAPNRKRASDTSYCILTSEERAAVTEATYLNLHLSAYFDECQYRIGTKDLWDSAFEKYWPLIPIVVKGTANLPCMRYFINWCMLVQQLRLRDEEETIVEMRKVLRARFLTLGWIPHPDSGRVWYTKRDKKLYKKFPVTTFDAAAPRVLIRCNGQPTF